MKEAHLTRTIIKGLLLALSIAGALSFFAGSYTHTITDRQDAPVYQGRAAQAIAPANVLKTGALQVAASGNVTLFEDWTALHHKESFLLLQTIASIWEKEGDVQFMVFGTEGAKLKPPFAWEALPFQPTDNQATRFWQLARVLWRIAFGPAPEDIAFQESKISTFQREIPQHLKKRAESPSESVFGDDAFCRQSVIEKQRVLEGKTVEVLYNFAPVGFGKERLHFLIVPKNHRTTFRDLTEEEYLEASELAGILLKHLKKTRDVKMAYLFHKSGVDAGQTVPHFHIHLIAATTPSQDFWGKASVLKNMVLGSSPMKEDDLRQTVEKYRSEFQTIQIDLSSG